jgi:WD40 repeat protein
MRWTIRHTALLNTYPCWTPPREGPTHFTGDLLGGLTVLPDGRLALGGRDGKIRLWDVTTGVETATLEQGGTVTVLTVLPDGRLASLSDFTDRTIRLWDVATGTEISRIALNPDMGMIIGELLALPDGRVAAGSSNGIIHIWDPVQGIETDRLECPKGWVHAVQVRPDGRLVTSSGYPDNEFRLWDLKTGTHRILGDEMYDYISYGLGKRHLQTLAHLGRTALVPLRDGLLAFGTKSGLGLWDLKAGEEVGWRQDAAGHVQSLALLSDGRLVSKGNDGDVRLWELTSATRIGHPGGHRGRISAIAPLSGGRVASASYDATIRVWETTGSGAEIIRIEKAPSRARALAVLPGNRLASGREDEDGIAIWSLETGTEVAALAGYGHPRTHVSALALLPDGRLASAGGSFDNTIRLWDLEAGFAAAHLRGHTGGVRALALLPDGRLASAGRDRTIRLWDVATPTEVARMEGLEGHAKEIWTISALPGNGLASGLADGTIQLWDLKSSTEAARLKCAWTVTALAVVSDRLLASAEATNTVRLWDLQTSRSPPSRWTIAPPLLPLCREAGLLSACRTDDSIGWT